MPSNLYVEGGRNRRGKRSLAATFIRWGLILVLASSLGASFVFVYRKLSGPDRGGKTRAQTLLENADIPEYGQAAMNALLDADPAAKGSLRTDGKAGAAAGPPPPRRKRLILLSDGEGKWNTGVWNGWGYDPNEVTLNWAAAGVKIKKVCPVQCEFSRDMSRVGEADAVVNEAINKPKFGIPESDPFPFPPTRDNPKALAPGAKPTAIPSKLPLNVLFYYEAASSYPRYTLASPDFAAKFDITMTPSQKSTLPIGMTCPWGRSTYDYVRPPPAKAPGRLLAYFNEHGIARSYAPTVDKLFQLAGDKLHSYIHRSNRPMPKEAGGDPYQLSNRLDFVGSYKFALVTEAIEEEDWIEPDLSQVWLAGAVPVYIGSPNVINYQPGPRSMVHMRDFPSADALWAYLQSFEGDDPETLARYNAEFFAWKTPAVTTFMMDEQGQDNPIGAGNGVIMSLQTPQAVLADQLALWAPRPQPDGAWPAQLAELKKIVGGMGTTPGGGSPMTFDRIAEAAWRNFRRRLDQCVHYGECRLCELVTLLTR